MSHSKDLGLLLARLGFGGFMICGHGWPKMVKLLSAAEIQFPDPIGLGPPVSLALAAFAEFVCAALVAAGLLTRLNLIPLAITMLVAAFVVHAGDSFRDREMALLYLVGYAVIFVLGPGAYTLQNLVESRLGLRGRLSRFLLR